jgi:predicted ArsR family transcriptional regulator
MSFTTSARSLLGFGDELEATRVYDALGIAPLRIEILRLLLSRREASAADVMNEFGLTRNGALTHLKRLSADGILVSRSSTHPRGSGPITYWSVDRDALADLTDSLLNHLWGPAA